MNAFAIVGASVLGREPFAQPLVEALRRAGCTVSVIKHAPDGFDMDRPGKASHGRRQAGAREVLLVGDRRLALLREYGPGEEPPLPLPLKMMAPVDIVVVEGFRTPSLPTLEVHRPSSRRTPHWRTNRNVIAVVSDEAVEAPVPVLPLAHMAPIADFVLRHAGLVRLQAPATPLAAFA